MKQTKGFILVTVINSFGSWRIYGLDQPSLQWYLKLHNVIYLFGLIDNIVDQLISHKVSGSIIIFPVLYTHDILLATYHMSLLHEIE